MPGTVVTAEAEAAQAPELAVLSVIAHGKGLNGPAVGRAALSGCAQLDDERAKLYVDLVFLHLSEVARVALEHDMKLDKYEYQSEFAQRYVSEGVAKGVAQGLARGVAQGEIKGVAKSVVVVLEARGFHVDAALRARIEGCESDALDDLLRRATSIETLDDLFV